mgnify:CR=1 FL=1
MKQILVFLFLLCAASVSAQDVIVKKDGSTIVCRVVELTSSEITYKKWDDLNGSNYVMNRADASAINYQNGKKVDLSEATNLYQPHNQNDGVQQYNDKALLKLDAAIKQPPAYKRAATAVRIVGWGIGAAAVGTGIYFLAFAKGHSHYKGMGAAIAAGGVAWTTGSILLANYLAKKGRTIESASIYQYNLDFSNGSSLSAGIDMLSDHSTTEYKTLGLGLRYNF